MNQSSKTVVVLGASKKEDSYSNRAVNMLKEQGHRVIPVNPLYDEIVGLAVLPDLESIKESVHTLSIYLSPEKSKPLIKSIVSLKPERVIFNPSSASAEVEKHLQESGIFYEEACTLVLIGTGQF